MKAMLTRTECTFLSWLKRGHRVVTVTPSQVKCGSGPVIGIDTLDRLVNVDLVTFDANGVYSVTERGRKADLFRRVYEAHHFA